MGILFSKTGGPYYRPPEAAKAAPPAPAPGGDETDAEPATPAPGGVGTDAPPDYDGDDTDAGDQLKLLRAFVYDQHPEALKAALFLCSQVFRIADGETLSTNEALPVALATIAWFTRHGKPYAVERHNGVLRQIEVGGADSALGSHA